MKKVKPVFALLGAALFFASCGSAPSPVEYNNKLMTIINENEKNMNAMNTAMSAQDFTKAETVRKTWSEQLGKSISEVDKMEAIKDDEGLKSSVADGLKDYKKVVEEDYKSLIGLRAKEKEGDSTVQAGILATLEKINHSLETTGGKINKAAADFEKKFSK
ncbi:LIC11966 family surface protein [Chitinophaga solisilvae]|uniref:LIC11966 family surface protein n=1 Tax=Chitinophaga solisilvae TaxID=1233460 RepID=UPI00136A72AA|nr:hypothetical protein [Chitinophaga solisilvae]